MYRAFQGPAGNLRPLVWRQGGVTQVTASHAVPVQDSIDVRTSADADVAYARFSPTSSFIQPTIRLYVTNTNERATVNGVWFTLDIPRGATITSATLTLYESETVPWVGGQDTFRIGAEQTDDAAHWAGYHDAETRHANIGPVKTVDLDGTFAIGDPHTITLPYSILQMIVDRAGWESGNRVCLMAYNGSNMNANNHQLYAHAGVSAEHRPRLQVDFEYVGVAPGGPGAGTQQGLYTEDASTDFPNPERGWYVEWNPNWTTRAWGQVDMAAPASTVFTHRPTLNMRYVRLDDFRTVALPQSFLNGLAEEMATWRNTDCKAVLRFAYNRSLTTDAPLSWVLHHIDQLSPLLHTYSDVIAVLQAGFMGAWGEWHTSTNNLDSPENSATLANALVDAVPAGMMVQFRTPYWLENAFGAALTFEDRFTGVGKAKAGYKNDCFRANWDDVNTFPTQASRDYIHAMGPLTVVGGETCDQGGLIAYNDCAPSVEAMEDESWDYLHSDYWTGVHNKWLTGGCLPGMSRRLGYRLVLNSVTVPQTVDANGSMTISINMTNAGFGKVYRPRPIDLVMVGAGGPFTVRLTSDARRDLPLGGATETLEYTLNLPAGLQAGQAYALHLRLPDPSAHLQARPGSCIRLANTGGVWDASTGRNNLNLSVTAS